MKRLLNTYGWNDLQELLYSMFPSAKYGLSLMLIAITYVTTMVEAAFGFKFITLVAFVVAAIVEVTSGIYASVWVDKKPFESFRIGRFFFKIFILLGVLFICNQFRIQTTEYTIQIMFKWLYTFFFGYGALEYIVSIAENKAVIEGKPKDHYTSFIKSKFDSFFKK